MRNGLFYFLNKVFKDCQYSTRLSTSGQTNKEERKSYFELNLKKKKYFVSQ